MFKNHPKGLPVLFFTEMWERFGFYLLLGIFVLYMQAGPDAVIAARSGLNMAEGTAKDIFGTYLALVYLTPFVGGLLADRILGYRRSIVIGGILMGLGYCGLAIPGYGAHFWIALLLIIFGNGFFKPNISTLVGNLYNDPRYREQKDAGYNIFYMGINIGAFACNFVAAYLRLNYGWGYAFLAAGIGMFIGVAWFIAGKKHIIHADVLKPAQPGDQPVGRIIAQVFVPAFAFAGLAILLAWLRGATLLDRVSTDAFLFACIPVVWFYAALWRRAEGEDRERIGAILPVCAAVIAFWAIFHQNGASLTDWAENYTRREMPASVASAAGPVGLVQEVNTGLREVKLRDGHGDTILDEAGKPKLAQGPDPYFNNIPVAERPPPPPPECIKPKDDAAAEKCSQYNVKLVSSELFQSINAAFIVLLTPVAVGFWALMRRRKQEPSTPGKIALGMLLTAASTLVMITAALVTHNGAEKGTAMWLIGTYFVVTLAELCLSPMGLSMVSKLSPPRFTALMMGAWFLSTSIGNKFAGILSGLFNSFETKAYAFGLNTLFALLSCSLIIVMLPRLRRVMAKYL
jgi:POT family proton-dependent oligopeptide transporter